MADDHPIFRKGLREVVQGSPDLALVCEVADGKAAWEAIQRLRPDVAILDVTMPGHDGLEVARKVQAQDLPVAVVMLTMHSDTDLFDAAVDAGVCGYLLKENAETELLDCVRAVKAGRSFFCDEFVQHLLRRKQRTLQMARQRPGLADLTPTERQILRLIAQSQTSKEIAEKLGSSPRTVENHRFHIAEKLGLRGAHSLVKFAFDNRASLEREA